MQGENGDITMVEYIDKTVALSIRELPKSNRYYQTNNLDDAYEQGWDEALSCIEKIPSANVAPVIYGRWINITRFNDGERIITCDIYNGFFTSVLARQAITTITITCCILSKWTVIIEAIHYSTRSFTV